MKPARAGTFVFAPLMFVFFLATWFAQLLFEITVYTNNAFEHGHTFRWDEFWAIFFSATFENWQATFLQLTLQGFVVGLFVRWGSSQIRRIEVKIDHLVDRVGAGDFDR